MSAVASLISIGSIGLILVTASFEYTVTFTEKMSDNFENEIIEEVSYGWLNTNQNLYIVGLAMCTLSLVAVTLKSVHSIVISQTDSLSIPDSKWDMFCTLTYPFVVVWSTFCVSLFVCLWTVVLFGCFLVEQVVHCNTWVMLNMRPSVLRRYCSMGHFFTACWGKVYPPNAHEIIPWCWTRVRWLASTTFQGIALAFKYLMIFTGIRFFWRKIGEWRKRVAAEREDEGLMRAIEENYVFVDADTSASNLMDESSKLSRENSVTDSDPGADYDDRSDESDDDEDDEEEEMSSKNKNDDYAWLHITSMRTECRKMRKEIESIKADKDELVRDIATMKKRRRSETQTEAEA